MRPYKNRLQWNIKGGPHHLIDGLAPIAGEFNEEDGKMFEILVKMIQNTLKTRLFVLILLYLGVIASTMGWILRLVPALSNAVDFLSDLASIMSGAAAIFLLLVLILNRRLGQLEADLVALSITTRT